MSIQITEDDVFRKVGRNLLLFQRLENVLKFLVVHGGISGYASELESKHLRRSETVGKQTLGTVAGQFFEQNFSACDEQLPTQVKEPYFSAKFELDVENANPEIKAENLSNLIDGRNDLVHHFLQRFKFNSLDGLIEAGNYLDCQHEDIMRDLNYFRKLMGQLQHLRRKYSEWMNSDEARQFFLGEHDDNENPKIN